MKITRREATHAAGFAALLAALVVVFRITDRTAFDLFFHWPDGGVWSNLAASFVLGVPAVYLTFRRLARQHAEHLREMRAQHQDHMRALQVHHVALIRRLTEKESGNG